MENRNPRLDLELVPVGGVDKDVTCSNCPAACCRERMILPLTPAEAESLENAGTKLRKLTRAETEHRPPFRHSNYLFESACGNLALDPETGATSCKVFDSPERPKRCIQLPMGGYHCVDIQIQRINRGMDEHVPDKEKAPLL